MYQDVVLYPHIASASAVIKCWPKSKKILRWKSIRVWWRCLTVPDATSFWVLTWVLLHVVEPPLPVKLHLHLLAHLQRWAHKMYSFCSLSCHPQHWDVSNQPMVIWLKREEQTVKLKLQPAVDDLVFILIEMSSMFIFLIALVWYRNWTRNMFKSQLTCPPPSGNKMVSWSWTLKPLSVSFFPLTSCLSSAGQQDTTEVTN